MNQQPLQNYARSHNLRGLLVAGNKSGSGKTSFCLGLASSLRLKGFDILAAKCGPDYIDRSWLNAATKKPVANIDCWMGNSSPEELTYRILASQLSELPNQILIIEGAMGLYDGRREGGNSCAELALDLNFPVILCLNVSGMGMSCAAMAQGFLDYKLPETGEKPKFLGLVCMGTGSGQHAEIARNALEPVLKERGIPLLACFPKTDFPHLPSRHLGLIQAEERAFNALEWAAWLDRYMNVDELLRSLQTFFPEYKTAPYLTSQESQNDIAETKFFFPAHAKGHEKTAPVIAIAHDEAFSFIYSDLPALLLDLGAKIVYFSPLHSYRLPDCNAIYLCGGYPELYAEKLSGNGKFFDYISRQAMGGSFIYAECGGYICLGKSLATGETLFPMANILPLSFRMTDKLQELGYREAHMQEPQAIFARGHVFHYAAVSEAPEYNFWILDNGKKEGLRLNNVWGSWMHLYPQGSVAFWQYWIKLIRREMDEN